MTPDPCNKTRSSLTKRELISLLETKEAELKEKEATIEENKAELKEKESILKIVEETVICSVCLSVPRDSRIPVCVSGHFVCATCSSSWATPTCPVCRADKVEDRFSVVAGKIADLLEVECANLEQGCTVKLLRPSLEEHEAACIYTQNLKCPNAEAYGCKVKVSVANCVEHIITCRIYDWCGQVNVNFPSRIPLYLRVPFHNDGWNHKAMPLKVFGTHDHIIVVGENHGDNTMIFAKCLSADRSRRYSLKLELNSPKLGQSKSNSGKTLLMTENLADSLEDGNVLLIHSKNFLKFKETGMAEVVITIDRKTEPVHKEAMEEGGKPPGTKRKMTDDKADKSNKKSQ